jgi:hypothetical protein
LYRITNSLADRPIFGHANLVHILTASFLKIGIFVIHPSEFLPLFSSFRAFILDKLLIFPCFQLQISLFTT